MHKAVSLIRAEGLNCRRTVANKYSQEELLLMRTQDVGYTSMKRQVEAKVRPQELERVAPLDLAECVRNHPGAGWFESTLGQNPWNHLGARWL